MKIRCYGDTDVGIKREINQDNFGISQPDQSEPHGYLLVVCDGMGGHESGEIASRIGVETILEQYYQDSDSDRTSALEQAFFEANRRISQHGPGNMGTTGVAALFLRNMLHIANVGDSRAYLIRDGQIKQISRDHSLVAEQVAAGIVTAEQARHLNYRNMITRALGYRMEVQVDVFSLGLRAGDIVLLSTDGLHGLVEDEELVQVVTTSEPEAAIRRLISMANERGGVDNITVALGVVDALDPNHPIYDDETITRLSKQSRSTVVLTNESEQPTDHATHQLAPSPPPPPASHSEAPPPSPGKLPAWSFVLAGGSILLILIGLFGIFVLDGNKGFATPIPTITKPGTVTLPLTTTMTMTRTTTISPTVTRTPTRTNAVRSTVFPPSPVHTSKPEEPEKTPEGREPSIRTPSPSP